MTDRYTLPPLPFDERALAPAISALTVGFHYGKHHKAYIDKTNELLASAPDLEGLALDRLVVAASKDAARKELFNNAAQAWNHDFYWRSLSPRPTEPGGKLAEKIRDAFGDVEACKQALTDVGAKQFGTGWAWLVERGGKLAVESTGDADTPLVTGGRALLTVDVWEHAWYLDYQNRKADYLAAVEKLLNWPFAEQNLG